MTKERKKLLNYVIKELKKTKKGSYYPMSLTLEECDYLFNNGVSVSTRMDKCPMLLIDRYRDIVVYDLSVEG